MSSYRLAACASLLLAAAAHAADDSRPGRDPAQAIDEAYTRKIRAYTTEPFFLSPLVDYLPASSSNVPTPQAVIGDIAGAPGKLPYAADVYRYMRMLEAASPRVKVRSIGKTEEGREMIAVAVASERLIAAMDDNRARLGKLADPRTIAMDDAEADRLVAASFPVYYVTGTIHSPETGAPTALMELAYRLAVDESPYVRYIRDHVVTLITPVVEVDGRDRQVDVYNWHLAHPGENWPPLVYWGHYVAHDNNRDAMGLTLNLTRNVLGEYLFQKPQVLHDLHESVPFLYDNTIGDGPYNAWLDPILTNEWQMIGWNNVSEMTRFGMPGVFTHGDFDTWSPGYLMFIAASHNGISRLYETFGNAGADTVTRRLSPDEYSRTWYRQNPPLPRVSWSQRNNNNYQQTGLLVSLHYFAENATTFLRNFYLKSKRSIEKPKLEGPAAYVLPADEARPGAQAELLRVLQLQGCEITRASAAFDAQLPAKKKKKDGDDKDKSEEGKGASETKAAAAKTEPRHFPAGSYIVRMDQPYSRIADMLLDYQYWSPDDPQKRPYDDTGWTFGELFGVQVARVSDPAVLAVAAERVSGEVTAPSGVEGSGPVLAVNHNSDIGLAALRYRLKDAAFEAAEEPFEAGGVKFARGSFLIRGVGAAEAGRVAAELGLKIQALAVAPSVKTHPLRAPRVALLHSWLSTQDEGWWRMALDRLKIPYDYVSVQTVAATPALRTRWDVVVFPPVGRPAAAIVAGMPRWGNALPWKTTALTPNIGKIDSTDDMRPGLGAAGVQNLRDFVAAGGLLIGVMDTAELAVSYGITHGVALGRAEKLKAPGTIVRAKVVDAASPITYGYPDSFSIYTADGPIFSLTNLAGGRSRRKAETERPTGRGTADDPDLPQGRTYAAPPDEPKAESWEALPLTEEQRRNPIYVIPPAQRPRTVVRYGDSKELLVSGLIEGAGEIAEHPAVIDVPVEKGHVVLFSNNPIWRGETLGSYSLVFNAILNFDQLGAGRTLAAE